MPKITPLDYFRAKQEATISGHAQRLKDLTTGMWDNVFTLIKML